MFDLFLLIKTFVTEHLFTTFVRVIHRKCCILTFENFSTFLQIRKLAHWYVLNCDKSDNCDKGNIVHVQGRIDNSGQFYMRGVILLKSPVQA